MGLGVNLNIKVVGVGENKNISRSFKNTVSYVDRDNDNKDNDLGEKTVISEVKDNNSSRDKYIRDVVNNIRNKKNSKKKRVGISDIDRYAKNKNISSNSRNNNKVVDDKLQNKDNDVLELKNELKVRIVKKIQGRLQNNINEIEVMESDLYFLTEDNDKNLELAKIQEIKKRIEEINKKIEKIKNEYNILSENYYLDDIVYLDDRFLLDDIIDYKYLVDNIFEYKDLTDDYKLLDEYKDIVFKIDEVNNMKERLVKKNEEKIVNYTERDEKYKDISEGVIKIDEIGASLKKEIDSQNDYLDKIMDKIGNIDKYEYMQYKVKGLGELIGNSLKYVGLLLLSPLAGFLPSIAISTIATRDMIKNIRSNMKMESVKKVSYVAHDFSSDLSKKLNDIDYVYYVIDDTLEEIYRLKSDFLLQYNSNIDGYSDTLKKINDIESRIMNNRRKVDIIKKRMIQSKKINDDKMIKVRKLNNE